MKSATTGHSPQAGGPQESGPGAVISRRAADRLRAGHLWVYRSDLQELIPAEGAAEVPGGVLATVMDTRGFPLGTALYSSSSQIALRLVSETPSLSRSAYLEQLRERVVAALALRRELSPRSLESNACRLIFSEADNLPGIVADRYNDLVVLQLLTQGTAQDDVRHALRAILLEQFDLRAIVERPDAKIRELEQLGPPSATPLYARATGAADPETQINILETQFTINGLQFHFDAGAGQKTGAFLDQQRNYAAAAIYAHGRALDVCTYQGGFALHLAQSCEQVTGIDASRSALEVADRNLALNSDLRASVDWVEADAFELLREFEASHERFDTIVLDPPAFAKTKRAAEGAMRGYKELNLRALKMLRPGGILVTCSCSHHVPLIEFMDAIGSAASDAKRRVQILETRGAAPDHPSIVTLPETNYLKCVICRVA